MNALLRFVVHKVWLIAVLLLIVVALYVSLGRVMLPQLHQYRPHLESFLSEKVGATVSIHQLVGDWQGFQPVISLANIRVQTSAKNPGFSLNNIVLHLDVFKSLLQRQPVFSTLEVEGVSLDLVKDPQGKWQLRGVSSADGDFKPPVNLLELLLAHGWIEIRGLLLTLDPGEGQVKQLLISQAQVQCAEFVCSSKGNLSFQGGEAAQLRFALNLENRPGDPDFNLDAYAEWEPLAIDQWMRLADVKLPVQFKLDALELGAKLWLSVEQGELSDIRGSINSPEFVLAPEGQTLAPVQNLAADFIWSFSREENQNGWEINLQNLSCLWHEKRFSSEQQRWLYSRDGDQQNISVMADVIDLEFFTKALLALKQTPTKLRDTVSSLNPQGRLTSAFLNYDFSDKDQEGSPLKIQLEANLNDVAVSSWKNVPELAGVNGYLKVTPSGGLVDFSSRDFSLFFPRLYSSKWHYDQASGVVSWENQGRALWLTGKNIKLFGSTGELDGQFSLAIPRDGTEPRFDLLIGMQNAKARPALNYVPDKKAKPNLVAWLNQSVLKGHVNRAQFVYSGSAAKGAKADTRSMRLDFEAEAVDLAYHKDWPLLENAKAQVQVSESETLVVAESGKIYDIKINQLEASFSNADPEAKLK